MLVLAVALMGVASPSSGEEASDLQRQIMEQKKELQELRKEVEALQGQKGMPAPTETTGEASAPSKTTQKSFQTAGAADKEEWPGFYRVPGTNTRFKLSGFAEADFIYDTDAVRTPGAFVTSAIVTRNATDAEGANGRTNFSVQATRLSLETRTPIPDERKVTTFIAFDFFNDFSSTTPEARLRQAYAEVNNFMHWGGDLLLGQDWSTFTDLYAVPNTLDFQGPNATFGVRHPMVRWTMPLGSGYKLKLAAEAPDLRNYEGGADSVSRWPDGVVAFSREKAPYYLMGSFLARDLRASSGTGSTASEFGWGASIQGRIIMPEVIKDDFFQFSVTYGKGIGGVMNDGPPDAVYNPATNKLELIPTLGWFAAYQHSWSQHFYSLATYGYLEQDNRNIQAPEAYKKTQYSGIDLVWTPDPRLLLGIEVLYGTREDKDGATGHNTRTLVTSRFNF